MEWYFRDRPRAERLRIMEAQADCGTTTVTALVSYPDGTERRVPIAVRKCDPAWLVDWPATRALWE